MSVPTKKLHLAALRRFFDRLVNRHACVINPAATVKAERYAVVEGKTPQIDPAQVRTLLKSIDVSNPVGLRDRAILAVLVYTAARVGAVAKLTLKSLKHDGSQYSLRFSEKGGKSREIPVRHDLEQFLREYIEAAEITEGRLFRTAYRKTKTLTKNAMTGIDICRMMKRRLKAAGLPGHFSPHSFRVTTVTDLLEQNVPLEDVQYLAGHSDPRTTRIYDRRRAKSRGTSSSGSRSDWHHPPPVSRSVSVPAFRLAANSMASDDGSEAARGWGKTNEGWGVTTWLGRQSGLQVGSNSPRSWTVLSSWAVDRGAVLTYSGAKLMRVGITSFHR